MLNLAAPERRLFFETIKMNDLSRHSIDPMKYNSIDEYELFALTLSVDLGG